MTEYDVREKLNQYIAWYKKGTNILHKEYGPAIEYADGTECWYFDGRIHREDGPAVYNNYDFSEYKEYWYQGQKIECSSDEEYQRLLKLKAFW